MLGSENIIQAHSDHVNKLADVQAYLTFHAYGTLLLYPYSASRFMDGKNLYSCFRSLLAVFSAQ